MEGVARPFLLPILCQGGGGRKKGRGAVQGIFSAFPTRPSEGSSPTAKTTSLGSTTDLQIATKKKKKCFYYLTTDNDIQMCLTSQSESQSESRQLRLHVHHSRAG